MHNLLLPLRRFYPILLIIAAIATPLSAQEDPPLRPDIASDEPVPSGFVPPSVGDSKVKLMLKLSDDPVAVVEAKSGRKLSESERNAIAAQLRQKQESLRSAIESMGGQILGSLQHAYNGLEVEIARSRAQQLSTLFGVVKVHALEVIERANVTSVPLIGGPAAWGGVSGFRGEGQKIAIIDSGIDYTHANFGGPGTVAAFAAADAVDTLPASASLFGPNAPKVKGGTDLVGDNYDAGASNPAARIPVPDPNPLDCGLNGHGSHVAGSAAGFGVLANGMPYLGAYDSSTIGNNGFKIGPGVAPKAELYAVRVFGCGGSTTQTIAGIEWAVANGMDVINMSLGSAFGSADSPTSEAADNAAKAGILVVTSAGNSGPGRYITGSPGSASGSIATAASEAGRPAATLTLNTGVTLTVINANAATFPNGNSYQIAVLRDSYPSGPVSLGCASSNYTSFPGGVAGKLVVTQRGICARVARAIFGQMAGAAAVAMINNVNIHPPFEGLIFENPDPPPFPFQVTIPFLGVRGVLGPAAQPDGDQLIVATSAVLNNAGTFPVTFGTFSSGGPRLGDAVLKPEVTAPGVSIQSTLVGSGSGSALFSGTSMSSPHVAGVAALARQSHPTWGPEDLRASIVSTADNTKIVGYATSRGGAGLVQAQNTVGTQAVAVANDKISSSLSFGYAELEKAGLDQKRQITVRNHSSENLVFNVSATAPQGSPHTIELEKTQLFVQARGSANVDVRLTVPGQTAGGANAFREVAGVIVFTPASPSMNNGISLRVPYYFVPRPLSHVYTRLEQQLKPGQETSVTTVSNIDALVTASADFYAWGLYDGNDGFQWSDLRAVGVQSFASPTVPDPNRRVLWFAVNTWRPWSAGSANEFDILIDVNSDGVDDYVLVVVDAGLLSGQPMNGTMRSAVFSLVTGAGFFTSNAFVSTDTSSIIFPVLTSQLCLAATPCLTMANPRISYTAASFAVRGGGDDTISERAKFNVWNSAISHGQFAVVAPNAKTTLTPPVSVNAAEWPLSQPLGVLVLSPDNKNGQDEAQLIPVTFK